MLLVRRGDWGRSGAVVWVPDPGVSEVSVWWGWWLVAVVVWGQGVVVLGLRGEAQSVAVTVAWFRLFWRLL